MIKIACRFLIDTGSSLTVCSVEWITTFHLESAGSTKAIGVSDHSFEIIKCADLEFEIAGYKAAGKMYFSDNSYFSGVRFHDAYEDLMY